MLGRFGKFTLVERIAQGGMAEVFKATVQGPEGFERIVAIKRLHRDVCEDPDLTQMLVDEARIAVQLNHPNIGNVFDLGCIDNQYFIIMEYIDGIDALRLLKDVRQHGERIPTEAALFIVGETLAGLHHAHTKLGRNGAPLGIVHRDVSPQNIMVTWDGRVKLVDFGIAKARNRAQTTQHGIIKGKFYYMAPEQAQGHHVDPRTDVYAAGMVLYEMLAGRSPYEGLPDADLLRAVRQSAFRPLAQVRPDLDPELSALVAVATQRNPDRRFANAQEFQIALNDHRMRAWGAFAEPQMARVVADIANAAQYGDNFAPMDRGTYRPTEESLLFEQPEPAALEAAAGGSDIARGRHNNPYDDNEVTQIYDANAKVEPAFNDLPPPPSNANPWEAPRSNSWEESTRNELPPRAPVPRYAAEPLPVPPPAMGTDSMIGRRSWQQAMIGAVVVLLLLIAVLSYTLISKRSPDPTPAVAEAVVAPTPKAPTRVAIAFVSEPTNAQVFVNEIERGTTPLSLDLEVGESLNVEFVKDGFEIARTEIVVQDPPQEVKMDLAQARGIVKILSFPPDAVVTIDGDEQGTTPLTLTGLETDQTYEIVATLESRSMTQKVNWANNAEAIQEVMFEFKDADGSQMKLALGKLPDTIATSKKSSAPKRIRRSQPRKRTPAANPNSIESKSLDVFAAPAAEPAPNDEDFKVFGSSSSSASKSTASAAPAKSSDDDFSVFGTPPKKSTTTAAKAAPAASTSNDDDFSVFGSAPKKTAPKKESKPAPKKESKKDDGLGSIWGGGSEKKKAEPKKKADDESFSVW